MAGPRQIHESSGSTPIGVGMSARRSEAQASWRQSHARWLTSFGDLLTLLLCFFIAVLCLTREDKMNGNSELRRKAAFQTLGSPSGTTFAHTVTEPVSRDGEYFALHRSAFGEPQALGPVRAPDGQQALGSWLSDYQASPDSMVEVVSCGAASQESVLMGLQAELEQAFGGQRRVRFSELGIPCSELRARLGLGADQEVVAALRVLRSDYGG